jgi:hypothetical protein
VGSESGQATVEWVGIILLVALLLGALLSLAPRVDGRSLGVLIAARITGHQERTPARRARSPGLVRRPGAAAPARAFAPLTVLRSGRLRALLKAGARKGIAANGLVCFLRKSTAANDSNRIGDDIGDAINCLNPIDGWTGDVGGTDD